MESGFTQLINAPGFPVLALCTQVTFMPNPSVATVDRPSMLVEVVGCRTKTMCPIKRCLSADGRHEAELAALKRRKGDFQKGNFESDLSKF
jgi:hypothetical protein